MDTYLEFPSFSLICRIRTGVAVWVRIHSLCCSNKQLRHLHCLQNRRRSCASELLGDGLRQAPADGPASLQDFSEKETCT